MKPWILGLTGGIGSGKSAAAAHFARLGIHQVDADHSARRVVEPGQPALEQIVAHLGPGILQSDGQLDRSALRARIFADPALRQWLEALLHPLIRQDLRARLDEACSPYAILVAPLLTESPALRQMVGRILVIDTPQTLQLTRTMQRDGVEEAQVQAILATQAQREERLRYADDVLCNDRDLDWLQAEVERLHRFYLQLRT